METETTPTAIASPKHKQQKTTKRNVLWVSGWVSGVTIDENDHDIIQEIFTGYDPFRQSNLSYKNRTFFVNHKVGEIGIAGEDDECRVWNLDLKKNLNMTTNRCHSSSSNWMVSDVLVSRNCQKLRISNGSED
jgi:hypothetical protein